MTIALDGDLPAGPWLATVTLHSGRIERTAEATITFPAAGSSGAVEATAPQPSPLSAAPLVALLAAIALMVALSVSTVRRHRGGLARGLRIP